MGNSRRLSWLHWNTYEWSHESALLIQDKVIGVTEGDIPDDAKTDWVSLTMRRIEWIDKSCWNWHFGVTALDLRKDFGVDNYDVEVRTKIGLYCIDDFSLCLHGTLVRWSSETEKNEQKQQQNDNDHDIVSLAPHLWNDLFLLLDCHPHCHSICSRKWSPPFLSGMTLTTMECRALSRAMNLMRCVAGDDEAGFCLIKFPVETTGIYLFSDLKTRQYPITRPNQPNRQEMTQAWQSPRYCLDDFVCIDMLFDNGWVNRTRSDFCMLCKYLAF